MRTGHWFKPPARLIFFPRIDDSHCDTIHSSLTAVRCLDNGYVGKQSVTWKEYCAEENMDRCTGWSNITEILLKMALNTMQSINEAGERKTGHKMFSMSAIIFCMDQSEIFVI